MTKEEEASYLGAVEWLRASATDIAKTAEMCLKQGSPGYQRLTPFLRAQAQAFETRANALIEELKELRGRPR